MWGEKENLLCKMSTPDWEVLFYFILKDFGWAWEESDLIGEGMGFNGSVGWEESGRRDCQPAQGKWASVKVVGLNPWGGACCSSTAVGHWIKATDK